MMVQLKPCQMIGCRDGSVKAVSDDMDEDMKTVQVRLCQMTDYGDGPVETMLADER